MVCAVLPQLGHALLHRCQPQRHHQGPTVSMSHREPKLVTFPAQNGAQQTCFCNRHASRAGALVFKTAGQGANSSPGPLKALRPGPVAAVTRRAVGRAADGPKAARGNRVEVTRATADALLASRVADHRPPAVVTGCLVSKSWGPLGANQRESCKTLGRAPPPRARPWLCRLMGQGGAGRLVSTLRSKSGSGQKRFLGGGPTRSNPAPAAGSLP